MRITATFFARSTARTCPAAFFVGVNCTSTVSDAPTTRSLVRMRPRRSSTNPAPRAVALQRCTTFACHSVSSSEGDDCPPTIVADRDVSSISAFEAARSSLASRAAGTSRVCLQAYERSWNTSGSSDSMV
jgi:hypothetical protein